MAFAELLDIETFTKLAGMRNGFERDAFEREHVDKAVLVHMTEMKDSGRLERVPGTENREIRFANAWNAFIDGTDYEWGFLLQRKISHFVLIWAIDAWVKGDKEGEDFDAAVRTAYGSVCTLMDEGRMVGPTFMSFMKPEPALDDLQCGKTGDRCRLVVEDWKPRLERFDMKRSSKELWFPVEAVAAPVVQTLEMDLPSGDVMICDYLRIEGFLEAMDSRIEAALGDRQYDDDHSTNSEKGRVATTRAVLAATGVLEIGASNTSVAVHRDRERLAVIDDHDTGNGIPVVEGMTRVDEIDCGRWTILVIDRTVVKDMLGIDDAGLDELMTSEDAGGVLRMQVAPGRWSVSFGEALHDPKTAAEAGVRTTARTWFTMARIG